MLPLPNVLSNSYLLSLLHCSTESRQWTRNISTIRLLVMYFNKQNLSVNGLVRTLCSVVLCFIGCVCMCVSVGLSLSLHVPFLLSIFTPLYALSTCTHARIHTYTLTTFISHSIIHTHTHKKSKKDID